MIMDIVPALARLFFMRRFGDLSLSQLQEALLIGEGLQHKTIDDLLVEFPKVDGSQLLALFNRSIRKIQKFLEVSVVMIFDEEQDVLNADEEVKERATKKYEEMMTSKMKPVAESLKKVREKRKKSN